jgi:hypothetical protein
MLNSRVVDCGFASGAGKTKDHKIRNLLLLCQACSVREYEQRMVGLSCPWVDMSLHSDTLSCPWVDMSLHSDTLSCPWVDMLLHSDTLSCPWVDMSLKIKTSVFGVVQSRHHHHLI